MNTVTSLQGTDGEIVKDTKAIDFTVLAEKS